MAHKPSVASCSAPTLATLLWRPAVSAGHAPSGRAAAARGAPRAAPPRAAAPHPGAAAAAGEGGPCWGRQAQGETAQGTHQVASSPALPHHSPPLFTGAPPLLPDCDRPPRRRKEHAGQRRRARDRRRRGVSGHTAHDGGAPCKRCRRRVHARLSNQNFCASSSSFVSPLPCSYLDVAPAFEVDFGRDLGDAFGFRCGALERAAAAREGGLRVGMLRAACPRAGAGL